MTKEELKAMNDSDLEDYIGTLADKAEKARDRANLTANLQRNAEKLEEDIRDVVGDTYTLVFYDIDRHLNDIFNKAYQEWGAAEDDITEARAEWKARGIE